MSRRPMSPRHFISPIYYGAHCCLCPFPSVYTKIPVFVQDNNNAGSRRHRTANSAQKRRKHKKIVADFLVGRRFLYKPASNKRLGTQLYQKSTHRFSPRHAAAPTVYLFAPSFRRLNIKSSQRKSTKHRQQTPANTRKRQEKGRLIYICAKKSPCQTATPRRAHSDLQANNDNITQNQLGRGKTSRKIQHTLR